MKLLRSSAEMEEQLRDAVVEPKDLTGSGVLLYVLWNICYQLVLLRELVETANAMEQAGWKK